MNPNPSRHFLYFRAIQGHSGCNLVDPTLQDSVLLPDDFAEYIYHIGNANEMHSIIKSGLIPGGRSLKKDWQSVFFTALNPMDDNQDLEEVEYDLNKPRIAVYKNTWRAHQNAVFWCNVKLVQRKGLQFYQTRSHAIIHFNILPAICVEKVVYVETGEEFYGEVYQSPRLPRVVLTPNSQHGRQGPSKNPDEIKSTDHESEERLYRENCRSLLEDTRREHPRESQRYQYRETCRGSVDYRIPGIPHSTVQQVDTNRKETVKKLIQQFESHPNTELLLQDFKKTEEINPFSEESKDLITDMGNTEIFELYETSSKKQCQDCALYWEVDIVYCQNKERFDVLSIPGYATKKKPSHGARHGPSMRQTMCFNAHGMLRKARSNKNGSCKTILERW